jgi:toxin ParE1/3/4
MPELRLVMSSAAKADQLEIWLYVADDSPQNADRQVDKLYSRCVTLGDNPVLGRQRDELSPGLRSFPVGRYVIFYRIKGEELQIVRILSGYRDIDSLF